MRKQIGLSLTLVLAAACGHSGAVTGPAVDSFGTLNAARVELLEEGGFAAFSTTRRASHDDRSFLYVRRQICAATCGAAIDSVAGTMSAPASDSLFTLISAQAPLSLHDDYGTTKNAADMVVYTLRVTIDGTTKVVRADDGTMPPAMRRIVDAVRGIVDASRQ